MRDCHISSLRVSARLGVCLALACIGLLILTGCTPFQQPGKMANSHAASATSTSSGSIGSLASPGAVLSFDPATAIHEITQWDLQVQSDHILDGEQTHSLHDSGWALDAFHSNDHLGYGVTSTQNPPESVVIGSVEYVFSVTDSASEKHYGLLLGTTDQADHAITSVIWLDAQPLTYIVQMYSAPVVEWFHGGSGNNLLAKVYTEPSEAELAAGLASGAVLHHTIAILFDLSPAVSSTSAKGGATNLSPAQVQTDKVIAALNSPGAAPLPAGVYSSAPASSFTVTPTDGATSPLNIILPSESTPHF